MRRSPRAAPRLESLEERRSLSGFGADWLPPVGLPVLLPWITRDPAGPSDPPTFLPDPAPPPVPTYPGQPPDPIFVGPPAPWPFGSPWAPGPGGLWPPITVFAHPDGPDSFGVIVYPPGGIRGPGGACPCITTPTNPM